MLGCILEQAQSSHPPLPWPVWHLFESKPQVPPHEILLPRDITILSASAASLNPESCPQFVPLQIPRGTSSFSTSFYHSTEILLASGNRELQDLSPQLTNLTEKHSLHLSFHVPLLLSSFNAKDRVAKTASTLVCIVFIPAISVPPQPGDGQALQTSYRTSLIDTLGLPHSHIQILS